MGGNARFIDRKTGEVKGFANKIDLTKVERKRIVKNLFNFFKKFNELYRKKFGENLWNDLKIIENGMAFNGSSEYFFKLNEIPDDEFVKYKQKVGDIDLTIPQEAIFNVWQLLNDLEGKKITKEVKYLGHKYSNLDPEKAKNLHQINAVFEYDDGDYKENIQIDFEAVPYNNGVPTEWAKFSHNSDWEDIKQGLKGVMHKYALMNLARAISVLDNVYVVTKKEAKKLESVTKDEYDEILKSGDSKKIAKFSKSKKYINPTNLAFSVAKGIRVKFKPVKFKDGQDVIIDGKPVLIEIPTSESKYETNLKTIFEIIFGKKPTQNELKKFNSFVGMLELMKKHLDKNVIERFFKLLVDKSLFGNGAQGLERNNPNGDKEIKMKMIEKIYEYFPFLKKYEKWVNEMADEYYKNYKMIDIHERLRLKEIFNILLESKGLK
jgi:hypothetical protein